MDIWWTNMRVEAQNLITRFNDNAPTNGFEEILFGAIRSLAMLFFSSAQRRFTSAQ